MSRLRACALLVLIAATPSSATTLNWKTASSGLASTAGSWSPSQAPTSTDDTIFNVAGTYTVVWNGVAQVQSQTYRQGTVTSTNSGAHTIGGLFRVGDQAGDNATLTIASGTITATTAFSVGNAAGSTGVLNVNGATAQITTPGTSDISIGPGGTGSLNLTGGGRVTVANFSVFGSQATGTGNLLVSGISGTNVRSRFATGPGTMFVGTLGHASVIVDNGGLVDANSKVSIANLPGSVGSVLVRNASGGTGSAFNVSGTLDVAVAPGASAAGTGSFDLTNLGTATISGLTTVGDPEGGTGTMHVRNGCTFTGGGLVFDSAHGVLDWTGGTIDVKGGLFDPPGSTMDMAGGGRRLRLESGASALFSNSPFDAYALIVGETGVANLDVLSGATLTTDATVAAGLNPASSGTIEVDGAAWQEGFASQFVAGLAGSGTLNVRNGGSARLSSLMAAYAAGSTGTVLVSGAGSSLAATSIVFGGHGTTSGGTASVTVENGASLSSDGDATGIRVLAPATLAVNSGATATAPVEIVNDGHITLGGGTISSATFTLGSAASLAGNGTVLGQFVAPSATALVQASGGLLDLGHPGRDNGIVMSGILQVGSAAVRLRSRGLATVGTCSMDGGTLDFLHPRGGIVATGKSLTGKGTVLGKLTNIATITSSTTGLSFADTLINAGTMNGAKFTFLPTATYIGQAAVNLDCDALDAQAGSRMEFHGNATLGKNLASTSVALAGRMFLDTGIALTVNHQATADCPLGTYTQLKPSASLLRAQGFSLQPGDTLEAMGSISSLVNAGVVMPGNESDPANRARPLGVLGTYTQTSSGKLVMELGHVATNDYDVLTMNGTATLGGTLEVRFAPGFVPTPGETFDILTFTLRTGSFANVTYGGVPPGNAFTLSYLPHAVRITVGSLVDVPGELPRELAFRGRSGAGDQAGVALALPEDARVRIALYSVTGRRIATLCDRDLPAGTHDFRLAELAAPPRAGVWFARAEISTPTGVIRRTARLLVLVR